MEDDKPKPRLCAKCHKKFTPTTERKLTCETCYRTNSQSSPLAEEPDINKGRKAPTVDDSIFRMILPSPRNTR